MLHRTKPEQDKTMTCCMGTLVKSKLFRTALIPSPLPNTLTEAQQEEQLTTDFATMSHHLSGAICLQQDLWPMMRALTKARMRHPHASDRLLRQIYGITQYRIQLLNALERHSNLRVST